MPVLLLALDIVVLGKSLLNQVCDSIDAIALADVKILLADGQ